MGLLVTLFLISSNVYGSLKAPTNRGFSNIEIWVLGTQGTILFAIIEYGFVLSWKNIAKMNNSFVDESKLGQNRDRKHEDTHTIMTTEEKIKILDLVSSVASVISFGTFNVYYWFSIAKLF